MYFWGYLWGFLFSCMIGIIPLFVPGVVNTLRLWQRDNNYFFQNNVHVGSLLSIFWSWWWKIILNLWKQCGFFGFFNFTEKYSVGFVLCQWRVNVKYCSWECGTAHPVSEAKKNFLCVMTLGSKTAFQSKYNKIQVILFIRKHL